MNNESKKKQRRKLFLRLTDGNLTNVRGLPADPPSVTAKYFLHKVTIVN